MPRRAIVARRSSIEWIVRGALAMVTAGLGYIGVAHSLGLSIRGSDPARAYALAPWDGRITARLAEQSLAANPAAGVQAQTTRFARLALRQDPTAVAAATTLGLAAQGHGNIAQARRLMAYAQHLSRRHLQTQLWAIEDAVVRGDVPGVLQHYDTALRTSKTAPDLLFPVLASAIADPAIRSNLALVLAKAPAWGPGFVTYVASTGPDPRATADLFTRLGLAGVQVSAEATSVTINSLITAGAVDEAWRYYALMRSGAKRDMSRDPRFTADLSTPAAFDWTPVGDASVVASIQRNERGGAFNFWAPPSAGAVALQQMQVLPAGAYRLQGHSLGLEQPEQSRPYWVLTCRDGRELGRIVMPNSAQANGVFGGRLEVPPGCPVQTLSLVVRASDDLAGVNGQITWTRLGPVR